jgi:hypothetical protein
VTPDRVASAVPSPALGGARGRTSLLALERRHHTSKCSIPSPSTPVDITIVGGGAACCWPHSCSQGPLRVALIESATPSRPGGATPRTAWATSSTCANAAAPGDEPDHFVQWLARDRATDEQISFPATTAGICRTCRPVRRSDGRLPGDRGRHATATRKACRSTSRRAVPPRSAQGHRAPPALGSGAYFGNPGDRPSPDSRPKRRSS